MADRIHALVSNELSRLLSMYSRFVPLSEREAMAVRLVAVAREAFAADLRRAAAGRQEYAQRAPEQMAATLLTEAMCYENAALIVEDPSHLMGAVPVRCWTAEEHASVRGRADRIEQESKHA